MRANLEARLRKIETTLPESKTIYRFAESAVDAERIATEHAGRKENVVICRWEEPDELAERADAPTWRSSSIEVGFRSLRTRFEEPNKRLVDLLGPDFDFNAEQRPAETGAELAPISTGQLA